MHATSLLSTIREHQPLAGTPHGELLLRSYLPGDEARILSTFNLVFRRECGPRFVDRDLATWRWQFLQNPAGTQVLLAIAADGTVVSQYAAVPQIFVTPFGLCRFVHVVDSMTHPDWRQGLHREGWFALLGRTFTDQYARHGNEVGYGFPVRIAERIGARLLDYHLLRAIDYLVRPTSEPPPASPAALRTEEVASFPAAVDELQASCQPPVPCALRKNRDYLHWRYVLAPHHRDYVRLLAWRGDQLTGVLVLRPRHELVPDSCAVVDCVVAEHDADTARALLAAGCRIAAAAGRKVLTAVFADHDPMHGALRAIGASLVPSSQWLERRLTYRITGPFVTPELLATSWRYALGDTDLC